MTHDEVRELIPAYALDAVGSLERARMQEHLTSCDQCRRVLTEHMEAAGLLGFTPEPVIPSRGLRERLMVEVAGRPTSASTSKASPAATGKRRGFVIAIAVLAGVILLGVILLPRSLSQSDRLSPEVTSVLASDTLVSEPLLPTREIPEASGQVFDTTDGDTAVVMMRGLDDPKGLSYTLWLLVDDNAVPLGAFEIDGRGNALVVVRKVPEEHQGMLVTLEDDPSTLRPGDIIILRST